MANPKKKPAKSAQVKSSQKDSADKIILPKTHKFSLFTKVWLLACFFAVVFLIALLIIKVSYANKILPGVYAQGIYVGGLDKQAAQDFLDQQTTIYKATGITLKIDEVSTKFKPESIDVDYKNSQAVELAYAVGHSGSVLTQIKNQLIYMVGRGSKKLYALDFNNEKLAKLYVDSTNKVLKPVQNAGLEVSDGAVSTKDGLVGRRVDIAVYYSNLAEQLGTLNDSLVVSSYGRKPQIKTAQIQSIVEQASSYVSSDITLTYGTKKWLIDKKTITDWLNIASSNTKDSSNWLDFYYGNSLDNKPSLDLDQTSMVAYLGGIGKQINTEAIDAQLTVVDGRATIFKSSQDGVELIVDQTIDKIKDAILNSTSTSKSVALVVKTQKAAISDDTISQLGVTDLLSEGVTYFPGSSKNRVTNIRVGQSRFNGVLIKPDEVFSFGKQMGPVGPEQGYLPGLVILNGREENQYGGGMCQVSSTLFRAALLAGLPIVERHNHAFAVSYYTAPFGVPGVDATIYYPGVDLKIKNDTGHYILIQTELKGSTLKFRLYGTKTKEGQIRGPQFISGTNDATKPSTTVFYRDIISNGQVIKTDTFTTKYKSSLDFPITAD